ncbi:hypothetical protein HY495_00210 [Candidatus Woesearchaeota archaeon]|nr:hypothetical protein [Candidatus Woesearchaeota archaeon]
MALEKIISGAKQYVSDSTAVSAATTPVYALLETGIARMPHDLSLDARLWAVGLGYCGLGALIGLGRDYSQKKFGITEQTREAIRNFHDMAYSGAFVLATNPFFYLALGCRDPKEIIVGSVVGAAVGAAIGTPLGYALDWFRDLIGVEPSERMPKWMKQTGSKMKKAIAVGLVTASVGLTAMVYHFVPDKQDVSDQQEEKSALIQIQPSPIDYTHSNLSSSVE